MNGRQIEVGCKSSGNLLWKSSICCMHLSGAQDSRELSIRWGFCQYGIHHRRNVCNIYGAQNETYMSRSAEKWVRGLCFNELGACDWNDGVKRSVYIGLHLVYFGDLLRLLWFTWGLRVVYIAFLLVLGVGVGWSRMVAEATFFMLFLKFDNAKLFHIIIIWYICRNKTSEYGKGNTCASAAQYWWNETERLVL